MCGFLSFAILLVLGVNCNGRSECIIRLLRLCRLLHVLELYNCMKKRPCNFLCKLLLGMERILDSTGLNAGYTTSQYIGLNA